MLGSQGKNVFYPPKMSLGGTDFTAAYVKMPPKSTHFSPMPGRAQIIITYKYQIVTNHHNRSHICSQAASESNQP